MASDGTEQYSAIPQPTLPQNYPPYPYGGIPPGWQTPPQHTHYHPGNVPAEPWSLPDQHSEILGVRLMNTLGQALARVSHSVLCFHLRGPILLKGSTWGEKPRETQFVSSPLSHGNPRSADWEDPQRERRHKRQPSSTWVQGIQDVAARMKFMQIWDFPNEETGEPSLPWGMNIGLGSCIEIDRFGGRFIPKARLQSKHAVLHILPSPCLELRFKLPLAQTSFVVDIRYRMSLADLENFWETPGHLMVNSYSKLGTGFHIVPGALDFDEQINIGKYTAMRMAASVQFPIRIPLQEGDEIFNINVRRLEVKTRPI